ncbi:hypothetical protein BJI69_13820 [Luteibacter rhizovicinus DSM 16549]|uniref:Uncharacterized protein n=1 Tax=Luteibacter rhizovicinus DSM 16549 TaxID=1440763 RepID=A0A0G9HFM7_9GAMM|nr:hypothetical protein [Luteibacter rhizovicinus]APG04864.1 hypothetical protein BJI69_13820 [Luteibacter rhizovicinus DSM 16549]KLD68528.1 hypothetical protein Y883_02345 [Luteibacter rhizovicinus DSM 16549]KLD72060.1 hypothetical protein Y886_42295 [Xanthomonas hyacinthi DSM 19077]
MDELTAFATHGAKLLESVKGDLTGDGQGGALLVLDPPPTVNGEPGQEPFRLVVLLLRDPTGQFKRVSENGRLVPCSRCGGAAGDPYAYSRVGKGQFTVVVGGGSRERWSDEYSFTYQATKRDWFVSSVTRKVFDTETEKEKHIDLTTQELGTISFTDFDPSHLPEVTLP